MHAGLTEAFNAIKSTLKVAKKGYGLGREVAGAGAGFGKALSTGLNSMGKGIASTWKGSSNFGRAGMGALGAGAVAGSAAAIDFANPWGLGFGD